MAKESRVGKLIEYNEGKLWFQKKSDSVIVGVTLAALDEIGDVDAVDFPSQGDDFDKDDVVCELDGSGGSLKLYAPAAGFVAEINTAVADDINLLNEDPLDEGWLVKIEIQDETDLKEFV